MSTNCLVSKLKDVVQNDNLEKLGVVTLTVVKRTNPNDMQRYITINTANVAKGCKITVLSDDANSGVSTSSSGTPQKTITINPNMIAMSVYFSIGKESSYRVEIDNKYAITRLNINGGTGYSMVEGFKINQLFVPCEALGLVYCQNLDVDFAKLPSTLTILEIRTSTFSNIKNNTLQNIANCKQLTSLNIEYLPQISGNVEDLGTCTKLTTMNIHNGVINGTVEGFVEAQCNAEENPRTATTTRVRCNNLIRKITFGGHTLKDAEYSEWLEWNTVSKIALYIAPSSANVYTAATKIWCKGYTQEEATTAFVNNAELTNITNISQVTPVDNAW